MHNVRQFNNFIIKRLKHEFASIDTNQGIVTWEGIQNFMPAMPHMKNRALHAYIAYWRDPFMYASKAVLKPDDVIKRIDGLFFDKRGFPIVFDKTMGWHVYLGAIIEGLAALVFPKQCCR